MIAGALYVALRRGDAPSSSSPPERPPHAASEQRVIAFLDAQRPRFRTECWDPIVAAAPEPASASYVFDVTVGADGHEVIRSIIEQRGKSRPDVARCLRAIRDAPIAIAAPGESVHVNWTLSLP
ncbi:MAG TPA: hypothetical protein VLX92_31465 [Kofleriaceae bacterium]|nr:hypothetical protein [Kofleriaceae bacterium]